MRVGGGAGPGALGASRGAGDGQGKEEMKDALQGERAAQAEASWLRGPREPKGGNVYLERGAGDRGVSREGMKGQGWALQGMW